MSGIYIASKCKHAAAWRVLRDMQDFKITCSWVDDLYPSDMAERWRKNIAEAAQCDVLVAYHVPGENPKGALLEIGAALAHGAKVFAVNFDDEQTFQEHPGVTRYWTIDKAFNDAQQECLRRERLRKGLS